MYIMIAPGRLVASRRGCVLQRLDKCLQTCLHMLPRFVICCYMLSHFAIVCHMLHMLPHVVTFRSHFPLKVH